MNTHKKYLITVLLIIAATFYFLADVAINPFILWTSLPLYVSYGLINEGIELNQRKKYLPGYMFLVFSAAFSLYYHMAWYFDWGGTKTASSTSALLFVWFPLYAVLVGIVGYFLGKLLGAVLESRAQ